LHPLDREGSLINEVTIELIEFPIFVMKTNRSKIGYEKLTDDYVADKFARTCVGLLYT